MTLLEIITPINIEEERRKFFDSTTYNPIFNYHWETKTIGKLYHSEKSDLKRAVISQDYNEIVQCAERYFDTKVDEKTLKIASTNTLQTPKPLKDKADDLVTAFQQAFEYFKLDYKAILSEDKGFNIRPQQSKKRIIISRSAELDFFAIDGEVKHEIIHLIRFENGQSNGIKRDKNYLPTEEGLASYLQDYKSKGQESSRFQHAAEYLVTEVCLNGSLREGYEYLRSIGFREELAWQRIIRHKFGFKNTSKPGDIMKPAMYFHYEQKIRQLNKDKILRLFVGKVSLDSLTNHPEYIGLIPKRRIFEFFNL